MKLKSCITVLSTFALTTLLIAPAFAAQASPAQVFGKLISGQAEEVVCRRRSHAGGQVQFRPHQRRLSREYEPSLSKSPTLRKRNISFSVDSVSSQPLIRNRSDKLTSKDDIVKALKDSFAFAEQAIETITAENAFEEFAKNGWHQHPSQHYSLSLAHTNDHYGQMVVYLRMNGIIPPASRK